MFAFLNRARKALTFLAFGVDKRAAKLGNRRIPEARLHTMELAFGWPGAFLGRKLLRHKSVKTSYTIVFWLIGAAHLAAWGLIVWWRVTRGGEG